MSLHSPPLQPFNFWNAVAAFAAAVAVPAAVALPAEGHSCEAGEERALARQASQDMTAFSQIYRRYVRRVYAYHLARTGNVQDAQDLTSQTFIAALESIPYYRGDGSFAAWLFGIAYHKVNDHYRRNRAELPLEAAESLPQPGVSPEDAAHIHLQLDKVSRVLPRIAPERAEALLLSVFGGLSMSETCQVLGKRESAVRVLIYRGLQDLRARIDHEGEPRETTR